MKAQIFRFFQVFASITACGFFLWLSSCAQGGGTDGTSVRVGGIVQDVAGNGISGVVVGVESEVSTVTNERGEFGVELEVPEDSTTLVLEFMGQGIDASTVILTGALSDNSVVRCTIEVKSPTEVEATEVQVTTPTIAPNPTEAAATPTRAPGSSTPAATPTATPENVPLNPTPTSVPNATSTVVPTAEPTSIATPTPQACQGDVNGDGLINQDDLDLVLFYSGDPNYNPQYDLNNDGVVNQEDVAIVVQGIECQN